MHKREEWRDINDRYQISNRGRLRVNTVWLPKLKCYKNRKKILTPSINNVGYEQYVINGKINTIHRLVATSFIPNPNNLSDVDHINGNKLDNRVENLRWVSHGDNMRSKNFYSGPTGKGIRHYRQVTEKWIIDAISGENLGSIKDVSERFHTSEANIHAACRQNRVMKVGVFKGMHLKVKKKRRIITEYVKSKRDDN